MGEMVRQHKWKRKGISNVGFNDDRKCQSVLFTYHRVFVGKCSQPEYYYSFMEIYEYCNGEMNHKIISRWMFWPSSPTTLKRNPFKLSTKRYLSYSCKFQVIWPCSNSTLTDKSANSSKHSGDVRFLLKNIINTRPSQTAGPYRSPPRTGSPFYFRSLILHKTAK